MKGGGLWYKGHVIWILLYIYRGCEKFSGGYFCNTKKNNFDFEFLLLTVAYMSRDIYVTLASFV